MIRGLAATMKDRKKTIVGSCFIPNLRNISYLCIYAILRIGSHIQVGLK